MKAGDRFTITSRNIAERPPLPLHVPRSCLSAELREGDIVTLGDKAEPARDWRTGIPVPPDQRFVIVAKDEEDPA